MERDWRGDMERDFLGLSSKEPLVMIKEEVNTDGCKEIGFTEGSRMSTLPHLMSFKASQEEETKKVVSDPLLPSGFLSFSTAGSSDPSQKPSVAEFQKSFNHNRQGGTHFSLTAYPVQHGVDSVHHPHNVKMYPGPNHTVPISMENNFFNNHYANASQNVALTSMKPKLLGGIPAMAPDSALPTTSSVAGVTDSCAKNSGSPAQLTIFYAGTVNVYNDISPEKAQAIMILAGNGSSVPSNMAQPKIQVQTPSPKPAANVGPLSQVIATTPCFRLSYPLSVSSHAGGQSRSGYTSTEDIVAAKITGVATTPVSKQEPPKMASGTGSITATTMISAVPQFRKASLTQFLEKRKERTMQPQQEVSRIHNP